MTTYPEVQLSRDVPDRETTPQSITTDGQVVTIQVADAASNWIVDIAGTFVGDLYFLSSMDNAFYSTQQGKRSDSDELYSVITGADEPATYRGSIAGFRYFHVKSDNWISGTATVNIRSSLGIGPMILVAALPQGTNHLGEVGVVNGASSLHATVDNFPATQPVTGTFYPATQPVSGTVAVSNLPISQPVTGSFFQATQPISGSITATISGTPHVIVDSGAITATVPNPLPVSGTFWQATQPVSGTVAVSNFPATQPVSGTVSISGTVPVSIAGTVTTTFSAPQHVIIDSFSPNPLPVSGTFFQATQPVSIAGTVAVSIANAPQDYVMAQAVAGNEYVWRVANQTGLLTLSLRCLLKNPSGSGKTIIVTQILIDNSVAALATVTLTSAPTTTITTNTTSGVNVLVGGAANATQVINYDTNATAIAGGSVIRSYSVAASIAGDSIAKAPSDAPLAVLPANTVLGINVTSTGLSLGAGITIYGIVV